MKNKILYGKPGIGKTINLFRMLTVWEGKACIIQDGAQVYNEFAEFEKQDIEILKRDKDFLNLISSKKIFYISTHEPFWINEVLTALIGNLQDNIKYIENPILIGIDSELIVRDLQPTLLKLLKLNQENPNIITVFTIQDLNELKSLYPKDYSTMFESCDLECPRALENFSGELRVRFPKELHQKIVENAAMQGVSLNSYITYKLTQVIKDGTEESKEIHKPNLRHLAAEILIQKGDFKDVANELGCTENQLSELLHGMGSFSDEQVEKICQMLEINSDDVFHRY